MKLPTGAAVVRARVSDWQKMLPLSGLILLVFIAYSNSFPGIFVQDDLQTVLYNPMLEDLDLARIFTTDYWGAGRNSGLFRPLTILSLALNRMLLGVAPWGYHLVNVLLHAAVVWAGYRVLLTWGQARAVAWGAAALFAVHPIHSEVVDVVVGRSELLAALFLLLALIAASGSDRRSSLLAAGYFLLALLCKEHAVVFLLLLPVFDLWRARTFQVWQQRLKLYGLLAAILALWLAWRQWGVDHQGTAPFIAFAENNPLGYLPPLPRILTALDLQYHYLAKLVWPYPLQMSYYGIDFHGPVDSLWSGRGMVVAGGWLVIAAGIIAGLRRRNDVAVFALFYLMTFSVTSNLFLPIGVAFAERLAYLPSLWFCAALASLGGGENAGQRGRIISRGALAGFIVLLLVLVWERNRDFRDPITLWRTEVARGEHDAFAQMNLAVSLALEGEMVAAEEVYRQLQRQTPPSPSALRSYTVFLLTQGRPQEAMVPARKALDVVVAQGDEFGEGLVLLMLGDIAVQLEDYPLALDYLSRPAVRRQDSQGLSRYLKGRALAGLGRLPEARTELEAGVPSLGTPVAWVILGRVRFELGDESGAEAAMQQAIAIDPDNPVYQEEWERLRQNRGRMRGKL